MLSPNKKVTFRLMKITIWSRETNAIHYSALFLSRSENIRRRHYLASLLKKHGWEIDPKEKEMVWKKDYRNLKVEEIDLQQCNTIKQIAQNL